MFNLSAAKKSLTLISIVLPIFSFVCLYQGILAYLMTEAVNIQKNEILNVKLIDTFQMKLSKSYQQTISLILGIKNDLENNEIIKKDILNFNNILTSKGTEILKIVVLNHQIESDENLKIIIQNASIFSDSCKYLIDANQTVYNMEEISKLFDKYNNSYSLISSALSSMRESHAIKLDIMKIEANSKLIWLLDYIVVIIFLEIILAILIFIVSMLQREKRIIEQIELLTLTKHR